MRAEAIQGPASQPWAEAQPDSSQSGLQPTVIQQESRKSDFLECTMGMPAAKMEPEPEPRLKARAKVRPKAQLTLLEKIRQALHVGEGDEVEFAVHANGTVTVRGYMSIPTDQAWFFTPGWLAGERDADEDITAGRGTIHESAEGMFAHLDSLGSADE